MIDYAAPGVVALDQAQVEERLGRNAYFGADSAVYGPDHCPSPGYSERIVDADSFFSTGFRANLKEVKIRPDADGRIRVTDLRCAGGEIAPTVQEVLWSGRDTIAILDHGVFLLLRKRP